MMVERSSRWYRSMRRTLTMTLITVLPVWGSAQIEAVLQDSITQAIDTEVWRPFVSAFNAKEAEAYLAVHAKNVVRWPLGWSGPQLGDSVRAETLRNWSTPQRNDEQRTIELWFTHRSHTNTFAYDIGYYRVTATKPDGISRVFLGHFTTILGLEDGRWKIFLDADNGDGVKKEDLLRAAPLARK